MNMKPSEPSLPDAPEPEKPEDQAPARVRIQVDVPHGARVRVKVTAGTGSSAGKAAVRIEGMEDNQVSFERLAGPTGRLVDRLPGWLRAQPGGTWLFGGALLVYLLVRIIRLAEFPIYFFTDEAIQTMAAVDLLRNSLKGPDGTFLPTYFQNGPYFNLSLSVYLQVLPTWLFGQSVFLTRAVSVLVSLAAAVSVGMILKQFFHVRHWWAGTLLLSITPAWFLHSRTAFETVVFVSIYAAFLYAYLLYRCTSPRFIYLALVLAALAFYAYSPGQLIVGATGVLLLLSDLPYHWQQRKFWLRAALVGVALALPYVRFRLENSFDPAQHLRLLDSYWIKDLPVQEKLGRFWAEYSRGVSMRYWFFPEEQDLARHMMKGYGNILLVTLPFFLVGLVSTAWEARSPAQRAVLIAAVCAPLGSALVGIGITRVLVFVIPAALMTGIGLSACLDWLAVRWQARRRPTWLPPTGLYAWLAGGVFVLLAGINIYMLRDALTNGPVWFTDYGLSGMQYGARQLFPAVAIYRKAHPDRTLIVSPNWANGTDVLARFFLPNVDGFSLGSVDGHLFEEKPLDDSIVFVMLVDEFERALASGKFQDVRIEQILPYPNGQDGFYFVRLRYVENISEILEREREARRELQKVRISLNGQAVDLGYSMLDMGSPDLLFDGDNTSVARTLEANPLVLDFWFDGSRRLNGVTLFTGRTTIQATARLYFSDQPPQEFFASQREADNRTELELNFDREYLVERLRLEVAYPDRGEPEHVHVWEVTLR